MRYETHIALDCDVDGSKSDYQIMVDCLEIKIPFHKDKSYIDDSFQKLITPRGMLYNFVFCYFFLPSLSYRPPYPLLLPLSFFNLSSFSSHPLPLLLSLFSFPFLNISFLIISLSFFPSPFTFHLPPLLP